MRLNITAACLLVCVTAMAAFSQEITGEIRGIVRDPSGAVISSATVEVTNTDRNMAVRTVTTGADGSYVAPLLPVGHYAVRVEAAGFKKYLAGGIDLHVSDRRVVDVNLQVGSTGESISVTEAAANP